MTDYLLGGGLVVGGAVCVWLLPWSKADLEGTERALVAVGRRARAWLATLP